MVSGAFARGAWLPGASAGLGPSLPVGFPSAGHVARPLNAQELLHLLTELDQPSVALEALALTLSLLAAVALIRFWRGPQSEANSVWFGRRIIDGALFPLLALLFALVARRVLIEEIPLPLFRLALPVLVSLAMVRIVVKALGATFAESRAMRMFERTLSWLVWLGMVLWVTGVLPLILNELDDVRWKIGGAEINLRRLVEGSLSAVFILIFSLSLSTAIESRLLRGSQEDLSWRKIASKVARAGLLGIGALMALSAMGIDLTALSVLGGALGVGVGFGLQKLAANYVSGFVILAERSLRIGDLVKVDNFEGVVTDINTRFTVLRAATGRESIVPNELIISQRIENASLADRRLALMTVFQVGYDTDLRAVLPDLLAAVASAPRVLADPAPQILLSNFAADGLELTAVFWVGDPESGQLSAKSGVNFALLDTLNRLGIDIPFPQRVVRHVPHEVSSAPS